MPVAWVPVVRSLAAVLPAMGALTVALGPYDGFFEDREVFLLFLAGLAAGLLAAFLEVSLLVTGGGLSLVYLLGAPAATQLAKAVVLNLPRFQGDPGVVFLGASMGAGLTAMLVLGYGNRGIFLDPAAVATTGASLAILAVGVAGVHVATGAVVGDHIARGAPFTGLARASLATLPLTFATSAHVAFRATTLDRFAWSVVAAVYGIAALAYARSRVLDRGLTDDQRRKRRREIRGRS